ncbi:hypothetical protein [Aquabacterium sp.]|uniref:hypothetical protein n=1 Tax=Aquabacterium sp. TaxID=1872578 RepID=UPI003D04FB1D
MSIEAMKRIKSLLQDGDKIDSHTISAVVAECDMAILAQQPAMPNVDVRTILLAIVPGDGNGEEVYAESVDDVVAKMTELSEREESLRTQVDLLTAAVEARGREIAKLKATTEPVEDGIRNAEDELNCAEEVLDAITCEFSDGEFPVTDFNCIGDYITAVVDVFKERLAAQQPATGEPVVSRNPFASRCYTMSESHLSGHRLIVGFEKLGDAQDAREWVARQGRGDFTHPAPSVPDEKPLPDLMMASYHEAIGWNACRAAMLAAKECGAA